MTANTNTTPVGTATATVVSPISSTSNGTGVVSAYNCSAGSSGTLTVGTAASGVTQTITATVTTAGTYNISTTANGVTFAASGTFAGTGNQNITLTATGTPTASGTNTFTLNTNPNCSFTRSVNNSPTSNGSGVVSAFNCNAGSMGNMTVGTDASGNAQSITATVTTAGTYNISASSNGVTFAGSGTFAGTGNQNITLTATGTPTVAGTNTFTINTNPNCSFSRTVNGGSSSSTNGSGVVSAFNCNAGSMGNMTVGTDASGNAQSITATVTTAGTYNISASSNGVTFAGSGTFAGTGNQNITLTATGTPTVAGTNTFTINTNPNCSFSRTVDSGISASTNGTGVVSAYNCSGSNGTYGFMTAGTAVSGVTSNIIATVTTIGTYNISTTANGVTFSASGTFTGTGNQVITLTASGTPTAAGSNSFTLNTSPNCSFTRTTLAQSITLTMGALTAPFTGYRSGVNVGGNNDAQSQTHSVFGGTFTLPAGTYVLSYNFTLDPRGRVYAGSPSKQLGATADIIVEETSTLVAPWGAVSSPISIASPCAVRNPGDYIATTNCTYNGSAVTLPAGTYRIRARTTAYFNGCSDSATDNWGVGWANFLSGGTITFTAQ